MKKGLVIGVLLLLGSTACLLLADKTVKKSNTNISLCSEGEKTGKIKGTVTNVRPIGLSKWSSTITAGSDGCTGSVIGNKKQLGDLAIIGSKLSFQATIRDGFISNPSNIQKDFTVPDKNGDIQKLNKIFVKVNDELEYYPTKIIIPVATKQGEIRLEIPREMINHIKWDAVNIFYYDDNWDIKSIE